MKYRFLILGITLVLSGVLIIKVEGLEAIGALLAIIGTAKVFKYNRSRKNRKEWVGKRS